MDRIVFLFSVFFAVVLCLTVSCKKRQNVLDDEQYYGQQFRKRGIEKLDPVYEEFTRRLCNPQQDPWTFQPLGVSLSPQREYTVTFKCEYSIGSDESSSDCYGSCAKWKVVDYATNPCKPYYTPTHYYIRYICPKTGLLKSIQTCENGTSPATCISGSKKTRDTTITFTAKSGYPLYLCVGGGGDGGTSVKASIQAKSTDGLVTVPTIRTEQYQNQEGTNQLLHPFCEYIILP